MILNIYSTSRTDTPHSPHSALPFRSITSLRRVMVARSGYFKPSLRLCVNYVPGFQFTDVDANVGHYRMESPLAPGITVPVSLNDSRSLRRRPASFPSSFPWSYAMTSSTSSSLPVRPSRKPCGPRSARSKEACQTQAETLRSSRYAPVAHL